MKSKAGYGVKLWILFLLAVILLARPAYGYISEVLGDVPGASPLLSAAAGLVLAALCFGGALTLLPVKNKEMSKDEGQEK